MTDGFSHVVADAELTMGWPEAAEPQSKSRLNSAHGGNVATIIL
jgi:hypothetical protein